MDNINLDPQQIQQMIMMLQAMLPKDGASNEVSSETKPTKKRKNNSKATKSAKPKRENKFEQMVEFRMHKEDVAIDKKLSVLPPVPRARPFELVDVICRVCGKREQVNPSLVADSVDRYKCNNCSTGAG